MLYCRIKRSFIPKNFIQIYATCLNHEVTGDSGDNNDRDEDEDNNNINNIETFCPPCWKVRTSQIVVIIKLRSFESGPHENETESEYDSRTIKREFIQKVSHGNNSVILL